MWEKIRIVSSAIWTFVLPYLKQMMTKAGPILAAAALEAVKTASSSGASNDQKRAAAYQMILGDLKKQGLRMGYEMTESLINASIEMAVLKMKG